MGFHEAFTYDQGRPGRKTESDAAVWLKYHGELARIMHDLAEQSGASVVGGTRVAEDKRTEGDAVVVSIARAEPPMTPEEARTIGNAIVTAWTDVTSAEQPPGFCDTAFPLPEQA